MPASSKNDQDNDLVVVKGAESLNDDYSQVLNYKR